MHSSSIIRFVPRIKAYCLKKFKKGITDAIGKQSCYYNRRGKNLASSFTRMFPATRTFYSENTSKVILLFPYFNYVLTYAHMEVNTHKRTE